MTRTPVAFAYLLAALCVRPAITAAQTPPDIEAQHQQGNRLREQRRDAEARAIFQQLWERTREPRALARLGLAEQALREYASAEAHLAQALASSSDPWIAQNASVLAGSLQQVRAAQGVSLLLVDCNVPGAEVFLNGVRVGTTGAPVRTSPGAVSFQVRAPGHTPESRTVTLSPGMTAHESVTLAATPATTPPNVTAAPTPRATPPAVMEPTRPPPAASGRSTMRTLAWVSAGTAVALLGVGVVGYVVGDGAATRWNDNSLCQPPTGATREEACGSERTTAETMSVVTVVGFVGAGVLGAASAVLFAVSPSRPARTAMTCGAGPGTAGVSCAVRF